MRLAFSGNTTEHNRIQQNPHEMLRGCCAPGATPTVKDPIRRSGPGSCREVRVNHLLDHGGVRHPDLATIVFVHPWGRAGEKRVHLPKSWEGWERKVLSPAMSSHLNWPLRSSEFPMSAACTIATRAGPRELRVSLSAWSILPLTGQGSCVLHSRGFVQSQRRALEIPLANHSILCVDAIIEGLSALQCAVFRSR